jgi:hypothetical protein
MRRLDNMSMRGDFVPATPPEEWHEKFGTAPEHVQKLYTLELQINNNETTRLRMEYLQHRGYVNTALMVGQGMPAIARMMAQAEVMRSAEFADMLSAAKESELQYLWSAQLLQLCRATYDAEVRVLFPHLGSRRFDIDVNWTVFHDPRSVNPVEAMLRARTDNDWGASGPYGEVHLFDLSQMAGYGPFETVRGR